MLLFSALLGQHLLFRFGQLFPGSIQLVLHLVSRTAGLPVLSIQFFQLSTQPLFFGCEFFQFIGPA